MLAGYANLATTVQLFIVVVLAGYANVATTVTIIYRRSVSRLR